MAARPVAFSELPKRVSINLRHPTAWNPLVYSTAILASPYYLSEHSSDGVRDARGETRNYALARSRKDSTLKEGRYNRVIVADGLG